MKLKIKKEVYEYIKISTKNRKRTIMENTKL
jgi:hypothetical protein